MASGTILKYADGTDSDWQPITDSTYTGTIYIRKIGSIVTVFATNITLKSDLSTNYRTLGSNLLANYAPAAVISFWAGNLSKIGQLRIATNGATNFFKTDGETWKTTDNITFSGTYMTQTPA